MTRYQIVSGSQSGHCCFEYTVVDTLKPLIICGCQYEGQFEVVCETFELEEATLVCDALNKKEI